jgi:hypothetical protein
MGCRSQTCSGTGGCSGQKHKRPRKRGLDPGEETDPTVVGRMRYDQRPASRAAPAAASSLNVPREIVILGVEQFRLRSHSRGCLAPIEAHTPRLSLRSWTTAVTGPLCKKTKPARAPPAGRLSDREFLTFTPGSAKCQVQLRPPVRCVFSVSGIPDNSSSRSGSVTAGRKVTDCGDHFLRAALHVSI